MIPFEKALRIVLDNALTLGVEKIPLGDAEGRYIARDIRARNDMPRYDQSAMDGFAVRLPDTKTAKSGSPAELILDGDLPAGSRRRPRLRPGRTVKVFTGSMLPHGTEAVVMVENSKINGRAVLLYHSPCRGDHIRRRGEEYAKGDRLIDRGTLIDPSVMGLLATFGHAEVPVFRLPRVTLLTLGDELVPVGEPLRAGKIYNSNMFSLTAALRSIGVKRVNARIVPDDRAALRREIRRGLRDSDVVLAAGGASVGDYDFVRPVARDIGIREHFRSVAIKPGKPVFFGTWTKKERGGTRLMFGVPGNPVSALVSLHQFIRPALMKIMGHPDPRELVLTAELAEACSKRPGRLHLLRGRLETRDGRLLVHPRSRQGSHMMGGLANADCLICFPREETHLAKGARVRVKLISW